MAELEREIDENNNIQNYIPAMQDNNYDFDDNLEEDDQEYYY